MRSFPGLRLLRSSPRADLPVRTASPQAPRMARGVGSDYRVEVVARGAQFHGANGLRVDAAGRLVMASLFGNEIVVLDRKTGAVLERIGLDQGVNGPDDIAFDPTGRIYWIEPFTGVVARLSAAGRAETVAELPPLPTGIAFRADGRLVVGTKEMNDALWEVYPDEPREPRLIAREFGNLNSFEFGADGLLYSPRLRPGSVVSIDIDSGAVTTIAGGLPNPYCVRFDSGGALYVLDSLTCVISRVDRALGALHPVVRLGYNSDSFDFDAADAIYATSASDGTVYRVEPNGTQRELCPGGMIIPGGAQVLPGGNVLVADLFTLRWLDPATGEQVDAVPYEFGLADTIAPITLAPFDPDTILMTSWLINTVQIYSPRTRTVVQQYADFVLPVNAVRFGNDMLVAEYGSGSVVLASSRAAVMSGLAGPAGLAASGGDAWVSDKSSGTVWQIMRDGAPLAAPIPIVTGLASPEGLAFDGQGALIVAETGSGNISRIDLAGSNVVTLAHGLAIGLPFESRGLLPPTGFAITSPTLAGNGVIYVPGEAGSVLYRLDPDNCASKD